MYSAVVLERLERLRANRIDAGECISLLRDLDAVTTARREHDTPELTALWGRINREYGVVWRAYTLRLGNPASTDPLS